MISLRLLIKDTLQQWSRDTWLNSGRVEYQLFRIYLFPLTHQLTLRHFRLCNTHLDPNYKTSPTSTCGCLIFLWLKSKDTKPFLSIGNGVLFSVCHRKATQRDAAPPQSYRLTGLRKGTLCSLRPALWARRWSRAGGGQDKIRSIYLKQGQWDPGGCKLLNFLFF